MRQLLLVSQCNSPQLEGPWEPPEGTPHQTIVTPPQTTFPITHSPDFSSIIILFSLPHISPYHSLQSFVCCCTAFLSSPPGVIVSWFLEFCLSLGFAFCLWPLCLFVCLFVYLDCLPVFDPLCLIMNLDYSNKLHLDLNLLVSEQLVTPRKYQTNVVRT